MRSVLHTMHFDVPFVFERVGGFRNLTNAATPIADSGTLSPFVLPAVDPKLDISTEYLTRIDQWGNIQERHSLQNTSGSIFLTLAIINDKLVAYNPQAVDLLEYFESLGVPVNIPCGLYFFECFFNFDGDPEPPQYHFKTEIFRIDVALVNQLRLPVGGKGDFSPSDFNDDFFITNP